MTVLFISYLHLTKKGSHNFLDDNLTLTIKNQLIIIRHNNCKHEKYLNFLQKKIFPNTNILNKRPLCQKSLVKQMKHKKVLWPLMKYSLYTFQNFYRLLGKYIIPLENSLNYLHPHV